MRGLKKDIKGKREKSCSCQSQSINKGVGVHLRESLAGKPLRHLHICKPVSNTVILYTATIESVKKATLTYDA